MACRQALSLDERHSAALHLMGIIALQAQNHDLAVEWVSLAIGQELKPEYFFSLGTILRLQGRHEDVLKVFDKTVELKFDNSGLWLLRGNAFLGLNRPLDALASFRHVLRLDPRQWDAANQCGILLQSLGQTEEALGYLDLASDLRPDQVSTLMMRAALLNHLKRYDESLALCRQAHALEPGSADICLKLGIVLRSLCRDQEALHWFDQVLLRQPESRDALLDRASILTKLRSFDPALEIYDRLRSGENGDATAELGAAHIQLLRGNFEAGWQRREVRWSLPSAYPKFREPMWLGREDLAGKTIAIVADEGLGDTIQFVRYVPMVAAAGGRVILAVQDSLHALFIDMPGVSECVPIGAVGSLPSIDFHCPIMSLPLAFGTTLDSIPASNTYLPPLPPDRLQVWRERLGTNDRFRAGIVWSGNANHLDDHNRSVPLRIFSRMFDVDASFISLQKEPKAQDKTVLQELAAISDPTTQLTDFVETAALVSCLDLVITVDTSVAHLAGALGRSTWTLISYTPDYRWLLDRNDSPWYPSMRLFRQDERRDWSAVVDEVQTALTRHISSERH